MLGSGKANVVRHETASSRLACASGGASARGYATSAVTRDSRFATLQDADVAFFRQVMGDRSVITDADDVAAANVDWMGKYRGSGRLLLRPTTSRHVAQVLQYCNERRLAVVPQGGNTGLVGGSVPVFDEIILSLSSMNKIISFDEVSGILACEAGCVLESLNTFLTDKGFTPPLDLGAKGSCQIGGNVSTNAGGIRLIRYGSLHGSVLGLEVVLADGSVLDLCKSLRKDNTGYDLKQLFIGAEGTLGVVTRVVLLVPPRPAAVHVALLGCSSFQDVQLVFSSSRHYLGEILSAAEFFDRPSLNMVLSHSDGSSRDPLPDGAYPFYVLIETSGSNGEHDRQKLDAFLEHAMEGGMVLDGTVAHDSTQAKAIWQLREGIAESLQKAGAVYKYDLSVPLPQLYDLVAEMRERMEPLGATVVGYGHLGDGNLHLNVSAPSYDSKFLSVIEPYVYEWVRARKGSVSAEHGLGLMKANAIRYSQTEEAVAWMKKLKALFDPNSILNPYKLLPSE